MDILKLLDQMKETVKNLENKDKKQSTNSLISAIAGIVAENILLKSADDTARSLVLSMVMANGGKFILKDKIDHKSSEYAVTVVPSKDGNIELRTFKKDIDTDNKVH